MFTPILDSSQRRPLYEQLYRYIRGEIEAGQSARGAAKSIENRQIGRAHV